jgi:hypothetical protein
MSLAPESAGRVDRLACAVTRVAGAALLATTLWQSASATDAPWIWALCWSAVGVAMALLYTRALRAIAIGLVVVAGVVLIGSINPFAAMDVPTPVIEQPDFAFWHVARALGASVLLVLLAYCVSRARNARLRQRAPTAQRSEQANAPPPRTPSA